MACFLGEPPHPSRAPLPEGPAQVPVSGQGWRRQAAVPEEWDSPAGRSGRRSPRAAGWRGDQTWELLCQLHGLERSSKTTLAQ